MTPVLAIDHWRFNSERNTDIGGAKTWQYVSPDGSTFLPARDDLVDGALYYGIKMADVLHRVKLFMQVMRGGKRRTLRQWNRTDR
jgi:hypothetical protein